MPVKPNGLYEVCAYLKEDPALRFDYLRLITAVDREEYLSSVYHLYSYTHYHEVVLRVDLDRNSPQIASVSDLWPTAGPD